MEQARFVNKWIEVKFDLELNLVLLGLAPFVVWESTVDNIYSYKSQTIVVNLRLMVK
jgi:hypothetical protein